MAVKRIIANIAAADVGKAQAFYGDLLGLRLVMDHGWILTFASEESMAPQISVATEGGSGTPVPDLSIEVDDVDAVLACCRSDGHRDKVFLGPEGMNATTEFQPRVQA